MPRRQKKSKETTPLDSKQRALAAQEAKVREEMERLQRLIEEAPKRAEIEERRRREEVLARAHSGRRLDSRTALVDKRFDLDPGYTPSRRRSLKAERREARLKFFGLIVLLIALVIFLFSVLPF